LEIHSYCIGLSRMMEKVGVAFLKAHLAEMSTNALKQLSRDILEERRSRGRGNRQGERIWRPPHRPQRRGPCALANSPRATAVKGKASELDSSQSGSSMDPAIRRPAPGPMPGSRSEPLSTQVKGAPHMSRRNPRANKPHLAAGNSATLRSASQV
jgi:hypothetical protein